MPSVPLSSVLRRQGRCFWAARGKADKMCRKCDFCPGVIDRRADFEYNDRLYAIKQLEREQFPRHEMTAAKRGDSHAGKTDRRP